MTIHPTAIVSPDARIGENVQIGPYSIVEADVTVGDDCILENHVVIRRGTTLGRNNRVFDGAVLGGMPQHVHIPERPGRLLVGDGNVFRENVTVHRALETEEATVLGNGNLLMVNAHVAHDCLLEDQVILTNNVMLGGHVKVGNRAFLSGGVAVHQFCQIGQLAMIGGQAHLPKDVPPFVTVDGLSSLVVGLNLIGLKRAGYDAEAIKVLKQAYRVVYRSGLSWKEILERLEADFSDGPAAAFGQFLSRSKRGIVAGRRSSTNSTIRLEAAPSESPSIDERILRVKAS